MNAATREEYATLDLRIEAVALLSCVDTLDTLDLLFSDLVFLKHCNPGSLASTRSADPACDTTPNQLFDQMLKLNTLTGMTYPSSQPALMQERRTLGQGPGQTFTPFTHFRGPGFWGVPEEARWGQKRVKENKEKKEKRGKIKGKMRESLKEIF